ncbi:MAG: N-glycosidase YbiA, partial [Patescibacteria group bacterium]|jgi:ribA/ribD-fused uncharacterized protein|nr:N-glycosidase YbiA [Patescibacteria group bacterium]
MEKLPLHVFFIYFSPYTSHAIKIDGVLYPTVEHAYQCLRYEDPNIIKEILSATSPMKAWEVSSKYKHLQKPDFKPHKREIMKKLMKAKADQHDEVKKALIDSGDIQIVKHITTYPPGDGYWDDGENGEGLNEMGKIWMEIREEIRIVTQ